jgi:hypothetical protein
MGEIEEEGERGDDDDDDAAPDKPQEAVLWEEDEEIIAESAFRHGHGPGDGSRWTKMQQRLRRNGLATKGRYKPSFHWNERIAQMCLLDPRIPKDVVDRIWDAALDGRYGPTGHFTRSNIVTILRDLKLDRFRERWKTILAMVNPPAVMTVPHPNLLATIEPMYVAIETQFLVFKSTMPLSAIRPSGGKTVVHKERHNIIPFNYLFRKVCEALDPPVLVFHEELPLLRTPTKLHILDDVMEIIAKKVGFRFTRTVVVKWPKIKKKKPSSRGYV